MTISKRTRFGALALAGFAAALLASPSARARRNPARAYCTQLGYEYIRGRSPEGIIGICKLPGDRYVDAWRFYQGEVGLEHSYCAQQGLEARLVEDPEVCWRCVACVMPDGALMPAAKAMALNTWESVCGDGHCGTMENVGNCPGDCSSGLYDEYCDGIEDGVCDRDCPPADDPDCEAVVADGGVQGGGGEASGCGCRAATPPDLGLLGALVLGLGLSRLSRARSRRSRRARATCGRDPRGTRAPRTGPSSTSTCGHSGRR